MKTTALSLLFTMITLEALGAQEWPVRISPAPKLAKYSIKPTKEGFLYETTSYRIKTAQKINPSLLRNFVMSSESVALALGSLPLPLFSATKESKPLIQLSFDEKSYTASGGAAGTAGFYNSRTRSVLIQWEQLSRTPVDSKLLRQPSFNLLIHELTHLNMHDTMWKMEPWFSEGIAEYLAAAHLSKGQFDFSRIDAQIRDHLRRQTAAKDQKVTALSIPTLLKLNSRDWLMRSAQRPPAQSLQSYTSALLLTHFAFHSGSERQKEVQRYLEQLEKTNSKHDPKPHLFHHGEGLTIEKKLKDYWATRGIQINFQSSRR